MSRSHVFDSNGPDMRLRGTAQQLFEKYLQLGRDATGSGDRVMAESYFQHAEHYFRILNAMSQVQQQQASAPQQRRYQNGPDQGNEGGEQGDQQPEFNGPGNNQGNNQGGQGSHPGHDQRNTQGNPQGNDQGNSQGNTQGNSQGGEQSNDEDQGSQQQPHPQHREREQL